MGDDHINEKDLVIFNGFACCWNGWDCTPDACGVAQSCFLMGCYHDCCCQLGAPTFASGCFHGDDLTGDPACCICGCPCCETGCKSMDSCQLCWSQMQCLCFAQQCALPCTQEIPAVCALFGLACYPAFGCCSKLDVLQKKAAAPKKQSRKGSSTKGR